MFGRTHPPAERKIAVSNPARSLALNPQNPPDRGPCAVINYTQLRREDLLNHHTHLFECRTTRPYGSDEHFLLRSRSCVRSSRKLSARYTNRNLFKRRLASNLIKSPTCLDLICAKTKLLMSFVFVQNGVTVADSDGNRRGAALYGRAITRNRRRERQC